MLDEYKYPYKLWAEAINTACHAYNRLYLRKLKNKTPYELLIGKKPNVKYFRVFDCKCFIINKKTRLAKFEGKTYEGIFVGYASNSHAYLFSINPPDVLRRHRMWSLMRITAPKPNLLFQVL